MSRNKIAHKEKDGLAPEWIDGLDDIEIAQVMEAFTAWPSDLNDEMSTPLTLATADRVEPAYGGLTLHGQIAGDQLILSIPPGARMPEDVRNIEIRLPDVHIVVSLKPSMA
jgi:hypothetical protein